METFSRSEIAHVVLWIHGRAVHRDFSYDSSLGNRLAVTRARLAFVSVRLLHVEIYAGSAGYPRCWRTH